MVLSAAAPSACFSCRKSLPRQLLCTQCRIATYCSVECQRRHRRSHRLACRAAQAQRELSELLAACDVNDASRDFTVAQEEVDRLQSCRKEEGPTESQPTNRSVDPQNPASLYDPARTPRGRTVRPRPPPSISLEERSGPSDWRVTEIPRDVVEPERVFRIMVQDLTHVSCYSVRLQPFESRESHSHADQIQVHLLHHSLESDSIYERTIVSLRIAHQSLRLAFPGHVEEVSVVPDSCRDDPGRRDTLTLRLPYVGQSRAPQDPVDRRMDAAAAATLACRTCHLSLVRTAEAATIRFVRPLPSSRWDDMMDYLTCYPGQAVVDFSTSLMTALPHTLLEGETEVVGHADDFLVSVLHHVPPYGQWDNNNNNNNNDDDDDTIAAAPPVWDASVRGARPWRSVAMGSTITCGYCAAILGHHVAPSSVRLWKHRLEWRHAQDDLRLERLPVSVFVGQELVRYAETMAVFVCRVHRPSRPRCLVLRILPGHGFVSVVDAGSESCLDEYGAHRLHWQRMIQVLYEAVTTGGDKSGRPSSASDQPAQWVWTSDWCCEPVTGVAAERFETMEATESAVDLVVEDDEWDQLEQELQEGSRWFAPEVAEATALARTGSNRARLSAILV